MSTYTPIAFQTLGSAAVGVTFSKIPQGYTDLVLIITGNNNSGVAYLTEMTFNGDTNTNYSYTRLVGTGALAQSSTDTSANYGFGGWTNNETSEMIVGISQIQNYSNSTTYKTWLGRGGDQTSGVSSRVYALAGLWRKTEPITSINLEIEAGTYDAGSTFSLYGIAGGGFTAKAAGGIVTTDATYAYHTFTTSGGFTPYQDLTSVDYLVVAGGGGGGRENFQAGTGGGGGAGGLRCTVTATGGGGSLESPLSLKAGITYPAVVGAGGAGYTTAVGAGPGYNGGDSLFSNIVSIGGGGGGGGVQAITTGKLGGSGGGAGSNQNASTYGLGTTNQGFRGGSGGGGTNNAPAGGGGGAGAVGGNAVAAVGGAGGAGGAGVATSISGSSVTYAGGGGGCGDSTGGAGGVGGSGGGGTGALYTSTNATAGTANTGGGAGGAGNGGSSSASRAGGSGIVIIRYAL
jgi:hypothetical protein